MKIVLATLAQPTYTSELYDWSLRDLADLFETKAFATQEEALGWATTEILQRNEEIAKENVECAAFRPSGAFAPPRCSAYFDFAHYQNVARVGCSGVWVSFLCPQHDPCSVWFHGVVADFE